MAVRLDPAHFNDVVIGFPAWRGLDSWRKIPAVLEVGESAHPVITRNRPKRRTRKQYVIFRIPGRVENRYCLKAYDLGHGSICIKKWWMDRGST